MFTLILVVLLVVFYFNLNGKIKRLEGRLGESEKQGIRSEAKPAPTQVAETTPISPVSPIAGTTDVTPEIGTTPQLTIPTSPFRNVYSEELSGRWLGKIGIVAIVLGVSFFLKWAFENNLIGLAGRVALGLIGGMALVATGQFLRKKYLIYSDVLTGGGIAILYLTIFAAFQFYHIITSQPFAFFLMFLVTVLSAVLSILGGTKHLAILGVLGGFLTPFLLSTEKNNLVGLMSYILLIDLGILAVAVFKRWVALNYLGFVGTGFIFVAWFERFYTKDQLAMTSLFLTLFFAVYLLTAIVHTIVWKRTSSGQDLVLTTINAFGYAFFVYDLFNPNYHYLMGFFFVLLGVLYFALAFFATKLNPTDKVLNFYLPGLAVVFISIALPVQLKGYWITLAWLIEAIALYAVSFVIFRSSLRVFGGIVYGLGVIRFFTVDLPRLRDVIDFTPVFNRYFLVVAVAIIGAYAISFFYKRALSSEGDARFGKAAAIFFIVAQVLSVYIITFEIYAHYGKREALYERGFWQSMEVYGQYRTGGYVSCGGYGNYVWSRWNGRYYSEFQYPKSVNQYQNQPQYDANGRYIPPSVARPDERTLSEITSRCMERQAMLASLANRQNTWASIAWALYAVGLAAAGFILNARLFRILGITLFFITAARVFIDVWSLGQVYRIISSITFGVLALVISFVYTKWKDRLKEIL